MVEPRLMIKEYMAMDDLARQSCLRAWRSATWNDGQSRQIILGLCNEGLWEELGKVWVNRSLRAHLWRLIDEIQRQADKQNALDKLSQALPHLHRKECDPSLSYPIKSNNLPLFSLMIGKGAKPSTELIRVVASRYDQGCNPFYSDALYKIVNSKNWKSVFGFNAWQDWTTLITRAFNNNDKHLLVVASRIMSPSEKIKLLKSETDDQKLDQLIQHMRFSKYVLSHANQTVKKKFLIARLEL